MRNGEIINRVAESGIITIDMENYYPAEEIIGFDLKAFLFMELILKEKAFRQQIKDYNWQSLEGKNVAIYCSVDAIIPSWAYMLVVTFLYPYAKNIFAGNEQEMAEYLTITNFKKNIEPEKLSEKRIVIKGCGEKKLSARVYADATTILLPIAKSIMYGEACSSVPVYKKK